MIFSVPYLAFTVETSGDKMFGPMLLHPLTKLKDIRAMLEEEQRTLDESDTIPLDRYGFTLDGREHLKEWRSLWGLGAFSGSVLYLRMYLASLAPNILSHTHSKGPRTISLTIASPSEEFVMEVEEDDTIAQVKLQFRLVSSQRVASDARLYYRYKLLQDAKTVKEEGLVGGETLKYHWGRVSTLPESVRHFHGETSNSTREAGGRDGAGEAEAALDEGIPSGSMENEKN